MSYTQISTVNQNQLSVLLRSGIHKKEIALLLRKHRTSIWRERVRNGRKDGTYHAGEAKRKKRRRHLKAKGGQRKIENNEALRKYMESRIKQRWSPQQISGRIKKEYLNDRKMRIGKDTLYKWIYSERKDLVKFLRCQKGQYRRRYGTNIRIKQREEAKKRRIDTRPSLVEKRQRIGDWEGDTIVGKDKNHILTHVERRSGMFFADKLEKPTAFETRKKTITRFKKIAKKKRCTVTYDNGTQFADYELTERETGMIVYFAYPYHSWERGCNENGLLRQYFPKGMSFEKITQKQIDKAIKEMNHRPRKRLDYLTPYEVFYGKDTKIG